MIIENDSLEVLRTCDYILKLLMQAEVFIPSFTTMEKSNQVGLLNYIGIGILVVLILIACLLCYKAVK